MSKSYYRVFFSSNSQRCPAAWQSCRNVKELLSCFLFKQFTTDWDSFLNPIKCQRATIVFSFQAIHNYVIFIYSPYKMSKSYYRVFFSSNSQLIIELVVSVCECQRATIVFSFQAIHNFLLACLTSKGNVKELLSCFLFKQFTTRRERRRQQSVMSKSYYRVFFSSNSQLAQISPISAI